MTRKLITCDSSQCKHRAIVKVHWPGQDSLNMCQVCSDRARGTGKSMGFCVSMEPLPGFIKIRVPTISIVSE